MQLSTMLISIFLAAVLLPNIAKSGPVPDSTTESLLIVGTGESSIKQKPKEPRLPELKSMHVTSNIRNRYARTMVETKYLNPEDQSQEATFTITLPDSAFISGFIMEIGGKKYEAYVREKEEAKREYQQAVERGQSAGHVAMSARDSKTFTVSVNVEPLSKVLFTLTYEQLLERKHGKYEMVVNLQPGQLVEDFNVDVNINETRRIVDVHTPALRSGNEIIEASKVAKNQFATISKLSDDETEVSIHFSPSVQQQKEMMVGSKGADESNGISGQFVVEYDVERDPHGGEVIVDDGYFVHFFAPSDLQPIPKHIVFVLDVSGSMMGKKMKQLRDAMKVILEELNNEDHFHLVKFSTGVQIWNENWENIDNPTEFEAPQPYLATGSNIAKVKKVVEKMTDEGMTNIYDALAVALRLTSKGVNNNENEIHERQPIIVFLTDGQANQGISNDDEILKMVNSRNDETKAAIFSLSFGNAANKEFLKNVAIKNLGFMRTIYEAGDASLQLENFYREISSPLLTNVNFIYADQVSNVTKNKFNILFKGSEFVVAGKLTDSTDSFISVEGRTLNGTHKFTPKFFPIIKKPKPDHKKEYGSLERLWAYMTIKQLLNKKYETANKDESTSPEKEALAIALKYSFVTPVSSLVVVKPNSTESQETRPAHKNAHTSAIMFGRSRGRSHVQPSPRTYSGSYMPMSASQPVSRHTNFLRFGAGRYLKPMSVTTGRSDLHQQPICTSTPLPTPLASLSNLPWWQLILTKPNQITIDNQSYLLGNNETSVESKPCQVNTLHLSGNCTLLTACPKIYPTLDSLDTYRKYFCTLESGRYAGVCCIDN